MDFRTDTARNTPANFGKIQKANKGEDYQTINKKQKEEEEWQK